MIFFFKPKPVVIDAFTPSEHIARDYAISPSNRHTPDWWRSLAADMPTMPQWPKIKISTMKRCQGFIDMYANSYTLPLWTDVNIELDYTGPEPHQSFTCADTITKLESHDPRQWTGFLDPKKFQHYKIMAPWYIRSKDNITWSWTQATWSHGNLLNDMTLLPAQVNFKYTSAIHVNAMMHVGPTKRKSILLEAGLPLINLTPTTDREIDLRIHAITQEEYNKFMYLGKFNGWHKEVQKYRDAPVKTCPFHFWK
jgi:hypothetical protein